MQKHAETKFTAEVIQKIPISSSGSAAVIERNLLRTVLFFGPHYICFLGLVRGYIRALFCQKLHFLAVFNCSVCALLLVRVSWGVFLAFFSLCFLGVSALLSSFFFLSGVVLVVTGAVVVASVLVVDVGVVNIVVVVGLLVGVVVVVVVAVVDVVGRGP